MHNNVRDVVLLTIVFLAICVIVVALQKGSGGKGGSLAGVCVPTSPQRGITPYTGADARSWPYLEQDYGNAE